MSRKIKIYIEGGGDQAKLKRACRRAFSKFFTQAGFAGRMPAVVACGSRNAAYGDFCTAVSITAANTLPLLLVDSEAPVASQHQLEEGFRPWDHLKVRDNWDKPESADDGQVHLMVQCMETWFLADRECLQNFFGNDFNNSALPNNTDIEFVEKRLLFKGLKNATRNSQKGKYGKGAHSFYILEMLNPDKIFTQSKWAKRLKETLERETE